MKRKIKRLISLALSGALALSLMSVGAFAAGTTTIEEVTTAAQTSGVERITSVKLSDGTVIEVPSDKLVTLVVDGTETVIAKGVKASKDDFVLTEKYGQIGSFGGGDATDYDYRAALYIDKTGIVDGRSVKSVLKGGTYSASAVSNVTINSYTQNFNGIIANGEGVVLTISNCVFNMLGTGDGSDVNDFSGFGAGVIAVNGAKVTLKNCKFVTSGVARPTVFSDEYGDVVMENCSFDVKGGTLYADYRNTADQSKMVSPPWVLGITGNARGTNMEGNCSTTTVVGSNLTASQWGVLSTDSGSDMLLTVADSTLTLNGVDKNNPFTKNYGPGYGTYIIGSAQEYFYGVTFNVGTYASILTGGDATYASSEKGKTYDVYALEQYKTGKTVKDFMGNDKEETAARVSSDKVASFVGQGKKTVINSDTFGFMAHNTGSLTVTDGTEVNSGYDSFVVKTAGVNLNVTDGAVLNTGNGKILQMMDNDDSLVGVTMPEGYNGPLFNTEYNETAGWHTGKNVANSGSAVTFNASDVTLKGDLYNGTGNYLVAGMMGPATQTANTLNVNLADKASLTGAISASAVMHVDENGKQNTHFTIDQYYYLGHMANTPAYNGGNNVNVVMTGDASWNVASKSIITSLTLGANATVTSADGSVTVTDASGKAVSATRAADGSAVFTAAKGSYLVVTPAAGSAITGASVKTVAATTTPATDKPTTPTTPTTTTTTGDSSKYTVIAGDSLWKIAAKKLGSGSLWNEIFQANRSVIKNPNVLHIGWILTIPAK